MKKYILTLAVIAMGVFTATAQENPNAPVIEFEAKNILPPSKKNENSIKNQGDFSSIFNPVTILNINFKNCLLAMGRHLENLILTGYDLLKDWLPKITHSIARIRQKIRPNRHYPRISHKPRDRWSNYRNLKAVKT